MFYIVVHCTSKLLIVYMPHSQLCFVYGGIFIFWLVGSKVLFDFEEYERKKKKSVLFALIVFGIEKKPLAVGNRFQPCGPVEKGLHKPFFQKKKRRENRERKHLAPIHSQVYY